MRSVRGASQAVYGRERSAVHALLSPTCAPEGTRHPNAPFMEGDQLGISLQQSGYSCGFCVSPEPREGAVGTCAREWYLHVAIRYQRSGKCVTNVAKDSESDGQQKAQFEIVARNEYTKGEEKNPVDCSLFYLALRKKTVLQGLWRMAAWNKEQAATQKLLANNFSDPKWKKTALKNAYALLSRRRFCETTLRSIHHGKITSSNG